jgi:hypothetical protein
MVGEVTGGNPSSTGVYYDDRFNHAVVAAGTTSCACLFKPALAAKLRRACVLIEEAMRPLENKCARLTVRRRRS